MDVAFSTASAGRVSVCVSTVLSLYRFRGIGALVDFNEFLNRFLMPWEEVSDAVIGSITMQSSTTSEDELLDIADCSVRGRLQLVSRFGSTSWNKKLWLKLPQYGLVLSISYFRMYPLSGYFLQGVQNTSSAFVNLKAV